MTSNVAKPGPKPKPDSLKILDGTRAARRDPAPPVTNSRRPPECPEHLDDVAREEWGRMVRLLDEAGTLSETDGAVLALYCSVLSRWVKAKANVSVDLCVSTGMGGVKADPVVAVIATCEAQMLRLLAELGMTPSSRARVDRAGSDRPKRSKLQELLDRRKAR